MARSPAKPRTDGRAIRAVPAKLGPWVLAEAKRASGLYAVHPAKHERLGHSAIVTTIAPSVAPRAELTGRLERYGELLASLGHDTVLGLLEVAREGDRVGVVSAAPEGPSLRALLDALGGGPLTLEDGVAMSVMIARAVGRLHDKGIAHLALAPENVFITPSGGIKLGATFDAREITSRAAPAGETAFEESRYRSPERIGEREPALESDVFSVGAIAFELLTGRVPWSDGGGPAAMARRVLSEPAPSLGLSQASAALEQTIARALEKQPSLRYDSAGRFAEELETLLAGDVAIDRVPRDLCARSGLGPRVSTEDRDPPPQLRGLALRLTGVLAAMILVMVVASLGDDAPTYRRGANARADGALKVLARPWAEVVIDGEVVDVTPIGHPISLAPGSHEIVLRHPHAPDERRTVEVGAGQTHVIDVDMSVVRVVDAGVDASP